MQQTYTKKLESAKDMERPLSIENVIKKFPNFRFTEKKKIGEGSYGIVSKAYDTQEKRWVALKKIKMVKEDLNDGLPHTFMREVTILSTIGKHENVIGILDIFFEDNSFIIAMEYADKGDLQKFLYQQKGYLSFASVRSILTQILEGVNFMHSKGLIHRDLKTSNILITAKGRVMIADFGLSKYARMPHVEQTLAIQSLWYRPPEILLGSTFYTFSVDYWSIGIIAHELIHKITPYGGTSEIDMLIKIFGHRGTPKFNELEDLQDYSYITKEFVVKFPRLKHGQTSVQRNRDVVPADLLAIILTLTNIDPLKRFSCKESLKFLQDNKKIASENIRINY